MIHSRPRRRLRQATRTLAGGIFGGTVMARRKPQQKFDLKQLEDLKIQLEAHAIKLVNVLRDATNDIDFDDACELRDCAQFLVKTKLVLMHIEDTTMLLVKISGQPQSVNIDECGLDWNQNSD
jgi:hypothetical protein